MFSRMKIREIKQLFLVVVAAASCACGLSQSTSSPSVPSQPQANVVVSTNDSIVIGPGDTLHVVFYDMPELEQRLMVSDSGNARFSLLGDVHVAGLSAAQASRKVEELLISAHMLKRPNVTTISIEQSATMQVSVLGEVHTPGSYEIGTPRNILEVISLAGGFTGAADRHITILHKQGSDDKTTVFLPNNANDPAAESALVYPGDTVMVPKAGLIYVLGDVNKPGGYYMDRDSRLSVLQAVGMAGGLLPNAAAPHARIVRKDVSDPKGYVDIPLQLRAIQNGKKADVQLQADDVIYVPFSYGRNLFIQSPAILAAATSSLIYVH